MKTFYWNNNKNDINIILKIHDKKPRYNDEGIIEKIEIYTNNIISMTYSWGIESLNETMAKKLKEKGSILIDDIDFHKDKIYIYPGFELFIIGKKECEYFYKWLYSCISLDYSRKKKINKLLN